MSKVIYLSNRAERPVKSVALKLFILVRRTQHGIARIPLQAQAVARDVSDAWRESARPNV